MSLHTMFDAMFGFVTGRITHEDAVSMLGLAPESVDAQRLLVSRRAYVHTVLDNANVNFPVTRRIVESVAGVDKWAELVTALGTAHPLSEIRFGTATLVEFLRGPAAAGLGLPPFVAELAELELTERRVLVGPDAASIDDDARLRVAEPLRFCRHRFDVLAVRRADDPLVVVPVERPTIVAVWRARQGSRRTQAIPPVAHRILVSVRDGGRDGLEALLRDPKIDRVRALGAARHLVEIEALQGELPAP